VIHACSGCNIFYIKKQLKVTASLIEEMPGKNTFITDSTYFTGKTVLISGNKDDHVSEVISSSDGRMLLNCA
jgi:hypothetical protein